MESNKSVESPNLSPLQAKMIAAAAKVTPKALEKYGRRMAIPGREPSPEGASS